MYCKAFYPEDIYRAMMSVLSEASVWERPGDADTVKLAYFNDGVMEMANAIVRLIDEEAAQNESK